MRISQDAIAGTLESSDLMVKVSPNPEEALDIAISSAVQAQFGQHIEALVRGVLQDMGVTSAILTIDDKGALDCTIAARVQAAVLRAADAVDAPQWDALFAPCQRAAGAAS